MDSPGIRRDVHMGKISSSITETLVAKIEISRSHKSYEHIEVFVTKRVARRDLGNRASQPGRPGSYEEALIAKRRDPLIVCHFVLKRNGTKKSSFRKL